MCLPALVDGTGCRVHPTSGKLLSVACLQCNADGVSCSDKSECCGGYCDSGSCSTVRNRAKTLLGMLQLSACLPACWMLNNTECCFFPLLQLQCITVSGCSVTADCCNVSSVEASGHPCQWLSFIFDKWHVSDGLCCRGMYAVREPRQAYGESMVPCCTMDTSPATVSTSLLGPRGAPQHIRLPPTNSIAACHASPPPQPLVPSIEASSAWRSCALGT